MLIRRVALQNVRSFLDREELLFDGGISIVVGPNGGGKTNLLDTVVIMVRRYLFASMYAVHAPTADNAVRYEFRHNDVLNNMVLERHSSGDPREQIVEIEVEVTDKDVHSMRTMQADADRLLALASGKYINLTLGRAKNWQFDGIHKGARFVYTLKNGGMHIDGGQPGQHFLEFLQTFEMDSRLREEYELAPLATPLVYLPVNRSASGFQASVQLASFNDHETKRHIDGASSRSGTQIVSLAIGRLAQRYRLLLEKDNRLANDEFRKDPSLVQLTQLLADLGYEWSLVTINPLQNLYDIQLKKQGSAFLVGSASSGERELLTYLFAIFALNVRDALIIVDEPELHLHPKWQKILLQLFVKLSELTGNQFLLATHAPTFISPESIQFVSRVFSQNQRSHIVRLEREALPQAKFLLNVVNSQNNERIFFADKVVLVEGISDRIFFEALLDHYGRKDSGQRIIEVVSVGGKHFFDKYARILKACKTDFSIVADLDYIEQVGTGEIKKLFSVDARDIKVDVIDNIKSKDAEALVAAIEGSINTGDWGASRDVWEYIKSRRRVLKIDMSGAEQQQLQKFIEEKYAERLYLLSKGSLEAYLPVGHASKDLELLLNLLAEENFIEKLNQRPELEIITKRLLQD